MRFTASVDGSKRRYGLHVVPKKAQHFMSLSALLDVCPSTCDTDFFTVDSSHQFPSLQVYSVQSYGGKHIR